MDDEVKTGRKDDARPVKEVVARQERAGSGVAVDSLRGTEIAEVFNKLNCPRSSC